MQQKVTIYSTPTCHFCTMAKDYFDEKGVVYEAFDVASDMEKRREMMDKSGQLGVPVIVVGDEIIVGFNKPLIDQMLHLK